MDRSIPDSKSSTPVSEDFVVSITDVMSLSEVGNCESSEEKIEKEEEDITAIKQLGWECCEEKKDNSSVCSSNLSVVRPGIFGTFETCEPDLYSLNDGFPGRSAFYFEDKPPVHFSCASIANKIMNIMKLFSQRFRILFGFILACVLIYWAIKSTRPAAPVESIEINGGSSLGHVSSGDSDDIFYRGEFNPIKGEPQPEPRKRGGEIKALIRGGMLSTGSGTSTSSTGCPK